MLNACHGGSAPIAMAVQTSIPITVLTNTFIY